MDARKPISVYQAVRKVRFLMRIMTQYLDILSNHTQIQQRPLLTVRTREPDRPDFPVKQETVTGYEGYPILLGQIPIVSHGNPRRVASPFRIFGFDGEPDTADTIKSLSHRRFDNLPQQRGPGAISP